ncbi:MAG TPA: hypothetical protein PL110_21655 [Candidatus Eremiobacteraeota bacterium]|nr:hypothetical protein [Candidatus Eremiobacteraeota bacterium]
MVVNSPTIYKQNTEPAKLKKILTREFSKEQVKYRPGRGGKQIICVEVYSR